MPVPARCRHITACFHGNVFTPCTYIDMETMESRALAETHVLSCALQSMRLGSEEALAIGCHRGLL